MAMLSACGNTNQDFPLPSVQKETAISLTEPLATEEERSYR